MIHVNGKEVDLRKAFPLTIGDLKKLRAQGCDVLAWRAGEEPATEQIMILVEFCIKKADPALTQDDIDGTAWNMWRPWSDEIIALMPGDTANPPS